MNMAPIKWGLGGGGGEMANNVQTTCKFQKDRNETVVAITQDRLFLESVSDCKIGQLQFHNSL